ncbi:MAG: type IV pilin-like G/H family protein [Chroococcidiopsidaceae cyanobacterium CP_BM_RX_35]|nr:type IV pilin-like G/H family protein [Chroococcidiopsidaceae cyanobacterium CP_BM_RX_35]
MKAEFQVKFLQYLNQKKRNEGFTLIELLVVIIIIGILAAIAIPTFLKQTANAKQATAKSAVGFVNTAQTVYRTENTQFASTFSNLALGLSSTTNNYTYSVSGLGDTATVTAQTNDSSLKGYSGGNVRYVFLNSQSESAIASAICEVNSPGTGLPATPYPLNSNQSNANAAIGCNGGSETQL